MFRIAKEIKLYFCVDRAEPTLLSCFSSSPNVCSAFATPFARCDRRSSVLRRDDGTAACGIDFLGNRLGNSFGAVEADCSTAAVQHRMIAPAICLAATLTTPVRNQDGQGYRTRMHLRDINARCCALMARCPTCDIRRRCCIIYIPPAFNSAATRH